MASSLDETSKSQALAIREANALDNIQDPVAAAERLGKLFSDSKMFGVNSPQQGAVLALACICEKKSPFELMRTFHVIGGKLSMKADAILAAFKRFGGKATWHQYDDVAADVTFSYNGEEIRSKWTLDRAKKAGLLSNPNWTKYPAAMLRARCISEGIRIICPEIVAGVYTEEEVRDMQPLPATVPAHYEVDHQGTMEAEVTEFRSVASPEQVVKLDEFYKDLEPYASNEFLHRDWIQKGQTYRDLSAENAAKAIKPTNVEKLKALMLQAKVLNNE